MPRASDAVVPWEKVVGYLLDLEHPAGASKARYFRAHGYHSGNVAVLTAGLLRVASGEVAEQKESPFGRKYVIRGDLAAPRGTLLRVETIWIQLPGSSGPRLVTAYPCG